MRTFSTRLSLRTISAYTHEKARGFETEITAPSAAPYVRVQALSASGALMRSSAVLKG